MFGLGVLKSEKLYGEGERWRDSSLWAGELDGVITKLGERT